MLTFEDVSMLMTKGGWGGHKHTYGLYNHHATVDTTWNAANHINKRTLSIYAVFGWNYQLTVDIFFQNSTFTWEDSAPDIMTPWQCTPFPQYWPIVQRTPSVTGGFPAQRTSYTELWWIETLLLSSDVTVMEQYPVENEQGNAAIRINNSDTICGLPSG